MRSILLWGSVAAAAAGCETTQPALVNCTPCKTHKTACQVSAPATTPTVAPTPGKPSVLPPSIKEVRMDDPEPRQFATVTPVAAPAYTPPVAINSPVQSPVVQQPQPANPGDVLLIPRWVYVPYSPHHPNGPSKMPANANQLPTTLPYVQAGEHMTVLPPAGAQQTSAATAQQVAMMEQCLQQMKQLNQRMIDLEAKNVKPMIAVPVSAVAPAPVAPVAPVITQIPPAATALPSPPQMLPLPPPLSVPRIPPAK